ncbi:AMIN domain-containing protein [Anabaena subtropica]|uniref:AMIN domain-containing protein n=1 Tax=Anabaena subtropica FACHB-260 TaxID=2692884 RepID=A0ABR8CJD4_9NOST|nr:AMIN domain-containing protein [Anabaena subtropica]MBD2342881.1 AMIN domain-containing protein [Anabaena subtropica FACHB-260]
MSNNIQGIQQLFGASLFTAITLVTTSSVAAQVQMAKLNNWRFYPDTKKLEITLSSGKTPQYFYLSEPPRLVVDIPDTKLGNISTQQNYTGSVQRVRVSQLNANVTRIVLDLAPDSAVDANKVQLQPISKQNPTRWVLRPAIVKAATKPSNVQGISPVRTRSPNNQLPTTPNYIQLPNTLSPITGLQQQPFVSVPPLNSPNPTPISNSPKQPSNFNNATSSTPPIPTLPNYPVIEFGQPLPK